MKYLLLLTLLASCSYEPTPQQHFDRWQRECANFEITYEKSDVCNANPCDQSCYDHKVDYGQTKQEKDDEMLLYILMMAS